eukprot:TRINITY_DN12109_c0_g1_i11.p1 TRINITY_DN12109_c0_g1~~TRINITY_DN12109_c0_g1_i11.p1  ORF type:complete len:224 (+),score=49.92 TRINITY_DN12109_c0_g1_i11:1166-1837(+)
MIMGTSCAHVMGRLSTINAALNSYLSGTCPLRWQPNNPMLHPRYNFAAIKVFKRIAVLGGSCPTIDLHDVLQYDPKMDMWGYQSLSMVNTTSDAKCQTRRSKMRKRASIGRSLMSTLGVRSKLCAAVIKIPSSAHNRSVCQEVDDYEQEFGSINMPSGASTVYGIVCAATSYTGVSVDENEAHRASPGQRRVHAVLEWLVDQGFIYRSGKDRYLPTLDSGATN